MPQIDLSMLNQRQTPAFYADVLANRPAAGFVGRIFVSTDTFAFYRDNGTTWDLIGGPGTGTITGSGANGQVSYWNGASTITGSNDLFWDNVNGHLGISTNTPGTALDVHHDQNTLVQLNQTIATNDTRLAFQNNGTALWRIGNFYNAGANDFGVYDVIGAVQQFTIKKTTGQTLIGGGTGGSGKLVVESGASDNGIQIVGTLAPSLRIDNANTGPTKRIGLGISTGVNNFIQGSADRDMCIFNGSTTASPMLFGIYDAGAVSVQEAARISAARNFLIGTTTDAGQKLQVNGTIKSVGLIVSGTTDIYPEFITSSVDGDVFLGFSNTGDGNNGWGIGRRNTGEFWITNFTGNFNSGTRTTVLQLASTGAATFSNTLTAYKNIIKPFDNGFDSLQIYRGNTAPYLNEYAVIDNTGGSTNIRNNAQDTVRNINFSFSTDGTQTYSEKMRLVASTGNLLIGTTTDAGQKLQVNGDVATTGVKFPATQSPSADVNTLDDYEEGTFVPELKFGGNNVGMTYFDKIGNYTKIGRQVTVTIYLALTGIGSSTGNATITNLPFSPNSSNRGFQSAGSIKFDNITYTGMLIVYVGAGASEITFQQTTNLGIDTILTNTNFNSDTELSLTLTYFTA